MALHNVQLVLLLLGKKKKDMLTKITCALSASAITDAPSILGKLYAMLSWNTALFRTSNRWSMNLLIVDKVNKLSDWCPGSSQLFANVNFNSALKRPPGPNFIKPVSTKICLAGNFFHDRKQNYQPNFHVIFRISQQLMNVSNKQYATDSNLVGNLVFIKKEISC